MSLMLYYRIYKPLKEMDKMRHFFRGYVTKLLEVLCTVMIGYKWKTGVLQIGNLIAIGTKVRAMLIAPT